MPTKNDAVLTEAGAVADLVSKAAVVLATERPIQRTREEGAPFVVLVDANGAQRIERMDGFEPPRKKASAAFVEAQSFIEYVNLYADAHSRLFCDVEQRAFTAILDYHDPASGDDLGRRGQHKATFLMKLTPEMEAWMKLAAEPVRQADFAEFLEDHYTDIEEPDGASILELAKSLEVRNNSSVKAVQRASDGGYNLTYAEDVSTGVDVPSRFLLAIPVFQGGGLMRLPVRLRFRAAGGAVAFRIIFLDLDRMLRAEVQRVREQIAAETKRLVWAGAATVG